MQEKGEADMTRKAFVPHTGKPSNMIEIKADDPDDRTLSVVCDQIRYYREKRNLEQKQLSQMLGLSVNAVNNWEKGRSRPDLNLLPDICTVLNITLYELYGLRSPIKALTEEDQGILKDYHALSEPHQMVIRRTMVNLHEAETMRVIPDLVVVMDPKRALAAGVGDPSEIYEECEPVYLYNSPVNDRSDFVFSVNGESMEPEYHDGDRVLVRKLTSRYEIAPGEIGAFMVNNELYIKQYQRDGLRSLNEAFPFMPFSSYGPVQLIGKVLGILDQNDLASEQDIELFLESKKEKK